MKTTKTETWFFGYLFSIHIYKRLSEISVIIKTLGDVTKYNYSNGFEPLNMFVPLEVGHQQLASNVFHLYVNTYLGPNILFLPNVGSKQHAHGEEKL